MASSTDVEPQQVPWERRYPGRLEYELARLHQHGSDPVVDEKALAAGRLTVSLKWPLKAGPVALRAEFPDGYPRLRPLVFLTGDPNEYPDRHCSPIDGNLCLLGRDTAQWIPSFTLAELLDSQLDHALHGGGDEDPQGESAEVWWNCFGLPESYVLVDSDWAVGSEPKGSLTIKAAITGGRAPNVQAAVVRVTGASGNEILRWNGNLPAEVAAGRELQVPWVRIDGDFPPKNGGADLVRLLDTEPTFKPRPREIAHGTFGHFVGVVYRTEIQQGVVADAWLLALQIGSKKAFDPRKPQTPDLKIIRTMRAGPSDVGWRVPAVRALRGKTIALLGVGAIGAPLALELARNGVSVMRLMDDNRVGAGNSIRWPLGASTWGKQKADSLCAFARREYPWCDAVSLVHRLGTFTKGGEGDDVMAARLLDGADLAIDASASYGATTLLYDYCKARELPLISLYATPPVIGGVVARYDAAGGCPVCLEYHHAEKTIVPPLGTGESGELIQPPSCAERTFSGGSYDLTELSLAAFRLALSTVSSGETAAVVETLSLRSSDDRVLPSWTVDQLAPHTKCTCAK